MRRWGFRKTLCLWVGIVVLQIFSPLGQSSLQARVKKFSSSKITELTVLKPNSDEKIALTIDLPEGWKRNMDFGTVVFEPANASDFFEIPSIEILLTCGGECEPGKIAQNIESHIQRLNKGWETLSTGNAELDKKGSIVEVLEDRKTGTSRLYEVRLTYPAGVSSAMYPPRIWIYRFINPPGDPFFILVNGKIPANLKNDFFPMLEAACLSVNKK